MKLTKHPLVRDLIELRGNPRACVYTEPLWGIPYNLYSPYATLYMYSLGLSDVKIGILLSVGMFLQVFASLMGGVMADKLGRRKATVIFDLLSWSVPCLIWMVARNYYYFLIAAIFNSLWKITDNSWSSLLVEDADKSKLVNIYTWITVSGLLAVFFAPLSGIMVRKLSVVPAMRILYFVSFVMMTAKFLILYFCSTETAQGRRKMAENRGVSILTLLAGYKQVFLDILKQPATIMTLAIMIILNIHSTITGTYFSLYVTENLGVPSDYLSYFPMVRAAIMLLFLFLLQYRFEKYAFKYPMLVGFTLYIFSQLLLIFSRGSMVMILGYIVCEAFAHALVMPRKDSMMVLNVDPEERSRIVSLLQLIMIAVATPFGYITGLLSSVDRRLTFALNIVFLASAMVIVAAYSKIEKQRGERV